MERLTRYVIVPFNVLNRPGMSGGSIHALVGVASRPVLGAQELRVLREPLNVVHAAVALLLLVIATVLAVYKPRGLTRYGYRRATRVAAAQPVVDAGA